MFFLAKFRYWLDRLAPSRPQPGKIVLGHTVPQKGPAADRIIRAFSRGKPVCPICDGEKFTPDELVSDKTMWSCGNPACGAMYTVADVSGYRFVELSVRSRLVRTKA